MLVIASLVCDRLLRFFLERTVDVGFLLIALRQMVKLSDQIRPERTVLVRHI